MFNPSLCSHFTVYPQLISFSIVKFLRSKILFYCLAGHSKDSNALVHCSPKEWSHEFSTMSLQFVERQKLPRLKTSNLLNRKILFLLSKDFFFKQVRSVLYSERNTLHRQTAGHPRGRVWPLGKDFNKHLLCTNLRPYCMRFHNAVLFQDL